MNKLLKFIFTLTISTIILTIAWDAIFPKRVYICTDSVPFDYLSPGHWIHDPYETVDTLSSLRERRIEDSDAIMKGWTVKKIWLVWWMLFLGSIILSVTFSLKDWRRSFART